MVCLTVALACTCDRPTWNPPKWMTDGDAATTSFFATLEKVSVSRRWWGTGRRTSGGAVRISGRGRRDAVVDILHSVYIVYGLKCGD
jgi:hypothetical protein